MPIVRIDAAFLESFKKEDRERYHREEHEAQDRFLAKLYEPYGNDERACAEAWDKARHFDVELQRFDRSPTEHERETIDRWKTAKEAAIAAAGAPWPPQGRPGSIDVTFLSTYCVQVASELANDPKRDGTTQKIACGKYTLDHDNDASRLIFRNADKRGGDLSVNLK